MTAPAIGRHGRGTTWVAAAWFLLWSTSPSSAGPATPDPPPALFVDVRNTEPDGDGTREAPLKNLDRALSRIPHPLRSTITVYVAPGRYGAPGTRDERSGPLHLHEATHGAEIRIVGMNESFSKPAAPGQVCLDWISRSGPLVRVTEGVWSFESIQLGTRRPGQASGFLAEGMAVLKLKDVRIHTKSVDGAGIHAHHMGRIHLYGHIELNEDLHEGLGDETNSWCSVRASDHGTVQYMGQSRKGSLLSMGNGGLRANYYGVIRLGFRQAKITSWGSPQQHNIAIANSGRVDLHGTTTVLYTKNPKNTPIGFEDDGHLLGEGARIIIHAEGAHGILLMKASRLFCYDIEFAGRPKYAVHASSGSTFNGSFVGKTDPGLLYAEKGSDIIVHQSAVELKGPFTAKTLGRICLPGGREIHSTPR